MKQIKRLMDIDPWLIKSDKLEKDDRRLQESLTSIGNGYMGMRGNFSESYSGDSLQGIYLAGVWYPDRTRVGWWKNGYPEYFGKALNAVNFSKVKIYIDGEEVDLASEDIQNFHTSLDMKKGTFAYGYDYKSVRISAERFFSLAQKELAVFAFLFESLDGKEHQLQFESIIDATVFNEGSNYDTRFWNVLSMANHDYGSNMLVQTIPNDFGVEQFTALMNQSYSGNIQMVEQSQQENEVVDTFTASINPENSVTLERHVIVLTSRDYEDETMMAETSEKMVSDVSQKSYIQLYDEHVNKWAERWKLSDIQIEGDDEAQQGIRFNLFQLFSTYYGEDERLNIGPKGFTGEKYGGATYWDTEAYAMPLYLALTDEKVPRNLLKYRYNHLEAAKHNARQQGLEGALYPMVTFNGIECHNEWEITFEEIHRNGAMAYAIYNYTNYTGDESYLAHEGLEVLVEISRFWASRVHLASNGFYMIHGVTGPNEYENNINNNWYTNRLAAWVLQYTTEALVKFSRPDLGVDALELATWHDIVTKMYYPKDEALGIFVQHDGFMDKELKPVAELNPNNLPLNQNWSWDKILRSPYIKQADVLQGIYFFGNQFSLEEKARNFNFYEPLTVHESSLSPSIHSIIASELGLMEKAVEMYQRTARLDLDNYNNDTDDGLHITSMTGSWLAIVQGFAQMKTWDGKLSFAPRLPENWSSYKFHINYRHRLLEVEVAENVTITLQSGPTLDLELYGQPIHLTNSITINTRR
ncbi:MAG: glycoside hydrolase family 65 protein [Streptococcaceae bacterium]|jgi:maltose phosphorylase|nr:glycoside hydrolase family 65 protein [Streptococcaceae bacterium]